MDKINKEQNASQSMTETARKAVTTALLHHKAMGNKVAFIKNGKIVHEIPSNIKKG